MLVLGREVGEWVDLIGPDGKPMGKIHLVKVAGAKVRLGFELPGITVLRHDATEIKPKIIDPKTGEVTHAP